MAQPEKRENSVLFSLRELRQIEENRVQEEEQAVRSAEQARVQAQQEAERRKREEEEARVRSERDAQLQIEQARENAEREARMRVESAEAAERQRQQAALEQQRLAQEMELRRAEVAKKRPTWMLAVTGLAVVGVVVAIILIVKAQSSESAAQEAKRKAEAAAEVARKEADEAKAEVDKLDREGKQIAEAMAAAEKVATSTIDKAEAAAAKQRLVELQKQQYYMNQRIAEAKQKDCKAERAKAITVRKECRNTAREGLHVAPLRVGVRCMALRRLGVVSAHAISRRAGVDRSCSSSGSKSRSCRRCPSSRRSRSNGILEERTAREREVWRRAAGALEDGRVRSVAPTPPTGSRRA